MAIDRRRRGIGGSDIGPILGFDDYRDGFSVWAEKKGDLPEMPPTDRQIVGQCLERGVLELYRIKTGRPIQYINQTCQCPRRPWMLYTVDALCTNEPRGVDAKVAGIGGRGKFTDEPEGVPWSIMLQCWWYMAALDYPVWDVAAFLGDGFPRIYTIERDLEAERVMLDRAYEFWRRYIDGDEIPPITGGDGAGRWLQHRFPEHKRPDMRRPLDDDELAQLFEYESVRCDLLRITARKKQLDNELKLAIGEREGIEWPDGKLTWRRVKDAEYVDHESMSIALLHNYVKDPEARDALTREYTKTRAGYRRLVLNTPGLKAARKQFKVEDDNE